METQTKQQILETALEARQQEVLMYQINIDNYTMALQKIAGLPEDDRNELAEFSGQLSSLLASELLEQKKAKIMLSVIQDQVT